MASIEIKSGPTYVEQEYNKLNKESTPIIRMDKQGSFLLEFIFHDKNRITIDGSSDSNFNS